MTAGEKVSAGNDVSVGERQGLRDCSGVENPRAAASGGLKRAKLGFDPERNGRRFGD